MARKLKPKPTPTPGYKDAQQQYRAFAFLVHICNWTRTEAYTACFPNTVSTGQSLNNVASRFWTRGEVQAIVEEIDMYEVQKFIDAKIALMEKNANSFAFAKAKPVAQSQEPTGEGDPLNMTDDELMANAVKLYHSAIDADGQLQAMKLITDLKKKLGTGSENETDNTIARHYAPISCDKCNLYKRQAKALQHSDSQ